MSLHVIGHEGAEIGRELAPIMVIRKADAHIVKNKAGLRVAVVGRMGNWL
jgi:hypothetical protein